MRKTIFVAFAAAACGGTNPIPLNQVASQLAAASCTNAVACGAEPDQATCLAATSFYSSDFFLTTVADATAGKIKYDGNAAASCVAEIKSQGCLFTGLASEPSDPCNKMFTGSVATGGQCIEGSECASGNVCVFAAGCQDPNNTCCTGANAGTCTARGAAGATCQGDAECQDGLFCGGISQTTGNGTCKALITTTGTACDSSFGACANPMYCDLFASSPTCKTPAAHAATCSTMDALPCSDSRDYCDSTTNKCTTRIAVGQACSTTEANCVSDALCDATTTKCVVNVGASQPCTVDANDNANCLGDLQCTTGGNACANGDTGCTCTLTTGTSCS